MKDTSEHANQNVLILNKINFNISRFIDVDPYCYSCGNNIYVKNVKTAKIYKADK
uniref:Uncharacterized protein n=1 Tax=Meloidogyne enterolobii TaxID=390850 RepID=A0A6V7UXB9_MELEN|nr:unnamed protein product [Meloidogyne enterolobii]